MSGLLSPVCGDLIQHIILSLRPSLSAHVIPDRPVSSILSMFVLAFSSLWNGPLRCVQHVETSFGAYWPLSSIPFSFPNLLKMKNMDHEVYLLVEVVKSDESLVHPSGWVTPEASTLTIA